MAKNNKIKLVMKGDFVIKDPESTWDGSTISEITFECENNLDTTKIVTGVFKNKKVQKFVEKFSEKILSELDDED